ncbi:hypothetical protein MUK42_03221 [Musa troglodytarum]|uniref:Uncharacterized protein n=1 Tax=Musa troglodytarum TaxID=320322 RepID=A0A9E7HY17_9LILI|nr:hypothetical protein MUK42_03221 [Musa troglodytarum]
MHLGADREEEEWEMSARPHVTITLGRSGQFVKRARPGADFGQSDHDVSSGRHQPTRESIRTENNNSSSEKGEGRKGRRRSGGKDRGRCNGGGDGVSVAEKDEENEHTSQ